MHKVDIKEHIKDYWNWRGGSYDKSPGHYYKSEEAKRVWINLLRETLDGENLRILDVGTGTGFLAILLSELGHKVTGIDIAEGMLEIAKKKADAQNLKIDFMPGDAENLMFEDNEFDCVFSRHLLWTLPNPEKAIGEWVRVTKPEGKIVVIDGKWHDGSIISNIRQIVWKTKMLISEGRISYHYKKEIKKNLPYADGIKLREILDIFRNHGLSNISVRDISHIRKIEVKNFISRIFHNYNTFLIKCERDGYI